MKNETKYYQVRVVTETKTTPQNNGSLVAEFLTYAEATTYLANNVNRYPNAFISSTYHV